MLFEPFELQKQNKINKGEINDFKTWGGGASALTLNCQHPNCTEDHHSLQCGQQELAKGFP